MLQHLDTLPRDERALRIRLVEQKILRRIVPGLCRKGMKIPHEALARRLILYDQKLPATRLFSSRFRPVACDCILHHQRHTCRCPGLRSGERSRFPQH